MTIYQKYISYSLALKTIFLTLTLGLSTMSFPRSISANPVPQVENGTEDSAPGGTRGDCLYADQKPLTALIPKTNQKQELTLAAHPTIFIYIPETGTEAAEFILVDSNNKTVYETILLLPETPGVMEIVIPTNAPELKIGNNYNWTFTLICESVNPQIFVQGSIQRVNPTPDLTKNLQQTPESDRWLIYSQAGIWHETLLTLAQQLRANPNDTKLTLEWKNLLNSVGLSNVATEPLKQLPK